MNNIPKEAIDQLNFKINSNTLKDTSARYIDRFKSLSKIIEEKDVKIQDLYNKIRILELEKQRVEGAAATLIGLAAEEEGLVDYENPQ